MHVRASAGVCELITHVVMPGISKPILAARANVACLQKPFAPSELVRKVRGLLDHAEKGAVSGKAG